MIAVVLNQLSESALPGYHADGGILVEAVLLDMQASLQSARHDITARLQQ